MRRGERYVEQDVNRLFNGRHEHSGGAEALRACELERLAATFSAFRIATVCTTTCTRRFVVRRSNNSRCIPERRASAFAPELARLQAAGMTAVLLQNKPSIVFSAYTYDKLGAEAFTLELGKARPFGQNRKLI